MTTMFKKALSAICVGSMALSSLAMSAGAVENLNAVETLESAAMTTTVAQEQQELYAQYQKLVPQIAQEYGIEASVEPISWFQENGFVSLSEMEQTVRAGCEALQNTHPTDSVIVEPNQAVTRGAKMYSWSDTQHKSNFGVTVNFSFSIATAEDPDTGAYFISDFHAIKPTTSGYGRGIVNSYSTQKIDGGRTHVTTANLTLVKDGVNYSRESKAYVYCGTSTGTITIRNF